MTINYQMPRQLEGFQGDDNRLLTFNVDKLNFNWSGTISTKKKLGTEKLKKNRKLKKLGFPKNLEIWKMSSLNKTMIRDDQHEGAWNGYEESRTEADCGRAQRHDQWGDN